MLSTNCQALFYIRYMVNTAMTDQDNSNKDSIVPSLVNLLVTYFARTPAWMLPLHLIYIIIVCLSLTTAYIIAFHWTSILEEYRDAHNSQQFSVNFKISADADSKIQTMLKTLNIDTGAMRTYVYRYHNGLAAINGVPFFFQSNIHEVIAPGISRVLPYEQRIPVSINVGIVNQFVQNKCVIIPNTEADVTGQNHYFFDSRGARSLVRCPITISNGDLCGFIGVDFPIAHTVQELAIREVKLREVAVKLGELYSITVAIK